MHPEVCQESLAESSGPSERQQPKNPLGSAESARALREFRAPPRSQDRAGIGLAGNVRQGGAA